MLRYVVYALVDPRSDQWRYIGKSCKGADERLQGHIRDAVKESNHKARWIGSLLKLGLFPKVEVLEVCSSSEQLSCAEMEWIAAARAAFVDLTNATDGGEGMVGYKWSPDQLDHVRRVRQTPEYRARMSAAKKGWKPTPEGIAKSAATRRGSKRSDEVRARMSEAHNNCTAEYRATQSAITRARIAAGTWKHPNPRKSV